MATKSQPEEADKSISLALASHYAGLDYDRIPNDVRQEGKRLLLDTLGCMIAAAKTNEGHMISQLAADLGAGFQSDGADFLGRAYEMGRLGNLLDLEECYAWLHFGAATVASAMAMARWRRLSGKELITALVAGYELGGQVSLAIGPHTKLTNGHPEKGRADVYGDDAPVVFAAVGAAARALNLSVEQTNQAYNLAALYTPLPTVQKCSTHEDLPNTKYAKFGWCPLAGVFSAVSAMRGNTSDLTILDGEKRGLLAIVQALDDNPQRFLARLGSRWHLRSIGYKRWPACFWFHSPLKALEILMAEHGIDADDVSEVVLEVGSHILWDGGAQKKRGGFLNKQPRNLVSLTLSLAHGVAMLLMKIPPQEWLNEEFAQTPAVQALRERVRFKESKTKWFYPDVFDDADFAHVLNAGVSVTTGKGTFRQEIDWFWDDSHHPKGRIYDSQIEAKFRSWVAADDADRIVSLLNDLERLDDSSALFDVLYTAIGNAR